MSSSRQLSEALFPRQGMKSDQEVKNEEINEVKESWEKIFGNLSDPEVKRNIEQVSQQLWRNATMSLPNKNRQALQKINNQKGKR